MLLAPALCNPDKRPAAPRYAEAKARVGSRKEMAGGHGRRYARTMDGAPSFSRAIDHYGEGRLGQARAELLALVAREPRNGEAWSALGYLHRDIGDAAAAASAFERALEIGSGIRGALGGRARMALERGEPDALDLYQRALAASPDNPQLTLELTEARIERGDEAALDDFAAYAAWQPEWTDGQIALARMKWESRRDPDFTSHLRSLLEDQPRRGELWVGLIDLLSQIDMFTEAADAARSAREAVGDAPELLLREAVSAGRAGEMERADELFARLPSAMIAAEPERALHHLRKGELEEAVATIDRAIGAMPDSVAAWAAAELAYRAVDDPRSQWLSGQGGLIQVLDLALETELMDRVKALLIRLHLSGVQATGQSVREGTQTRWRLFDRIEPELTQFKQVLDEAIARYVDGLPARDERHPLLRHRDAKLRITGSWSVRLTGSGRHVSHIHPLGLIGSAFYVIVPEDGAGELELGCPPPDLKLELRPLRVIAPHPGRLVLFPSYVHHGTKPFRSGERISVAFDVARDPAAT